MSARRNKRRRRKRKVRCQVKRDDSKDSKDSKNTGGTEKTGNTGKTGKTGKIIQIGGAVKQESKVKKYISPKKIDKEESNGEKMRLGTLRFSPKVWAKLQYLYDSMDVEISGMGVAPADNPWYVEEFHLLEQEGSSTHTSLDGESLGEFYDEQVDKGRHPYQFGRIWIHTHPDFISKGPSGGDKVTFREVFGECNWAIMVVVAGTTIGDVSATLHVRIQERWSLQVKLGVEVDWSGAYSDCVEGWEKEVESKVWEQTYVKTAIITKATDRRVVKGTWPPPGTQTRSKMGYGRASESDTDADDGAMDLTKASEYMRADEVTELRNAGFTMAEIDKEGYGLVGLNAGETTMYCWSCGREKPTQDMEECPSCQQDLCMDCWPDGTACPVCGNVIGAVDGTD